MCRLLCELLGQSPMEFNLIIQRLESASGHNRVDINLAAEIKALSSQKIQELGLDPKDTSGRELYHGLNVLMQKHDEMLVKAIGAEDADSPHDLAVKVSSAIEQAEHLPKNCWALKHSTAKRLLKNLPPKNLMKNLGYRSIDSLLKRESIEEILAALRFTQSERWLKSFYNSFSNLTPSDFAETHLKVLILPEKRWSKLVNLKNGQSSQVSLNLPELGAVVISLPHRRYFNGLAFALTAWLSQYINLAHQSSTYLKLQQVRADFGKVLSDYLQAKSEPIMNIAGQSLNWSFVGQYFAKTNNSASLELIGPHLQSDEIKCLSPADVLAAIEPGLSFWQGLEWAALDSQDGPVSFNVLDVATNFINGADYQNRNVKNVQNSLWGELMVRYLGQERLEEQLLKNLSLDITADSKSIEQLISNEFEMPNVNLAEAT